jgi:hypothetical protein
MRFLLVRSAEYGLKSGRATSTGRYLVKESLVNIRAMKARSEAE